MVPRHRVRGRDSSPMVPNLDCATVRLKHPSVSMSAIVEGAELRARRPHGPRTPRAHSGIPRGIPIHDRRPNSLRRRAVGGRPHGLNDRYPAPLARRLHWRAPHARPTTMSSVHRGFPRPCRAFPDRNVDSGGRAAPTMWPQPPTLPPLGLRTGCGERLAYSGDSSSALGRVRIVQP